MSEVFTGLRHASRIGPGQSGPGDPSLASFIIRLQGPPKRGTRYERYGHTMTVLQNGKVLVAGGNSASSFSIKSAELYDPSPDNGIGRARSIRRGDITSPPCCRMAKSCRRRILHRIAPRRHPRRVPSCGVQ